PGLTYGTFLGGSGSDGGSGIAVDGSGAAYVAGSTGSPDFGFGGAPGFDQSFNGAYDAFVVKLAANGQSLAYGTFLGGTSEASYGNGIAVDLSGAAYVTGFSFSSDFGFGGAPGFDQTQ